MSAALPIVLDTDVGTDVDDAIAIALLLGSPEIDLSAVTTVSGDTGLRARIAKRLLSLAGRPEVPVAAGIREPVLRQRNFLWVGHEGQGILQSGAQLPIAPMHAVDLMIETILRERPQVLTIGPLSNLAVAIMKEPSVIAAIPHLTIMGGSFSRDGQTPLIEYNLGSDAEAAVVVLSAGIPITLVPLDVTLQVALRRAELTRLRCARSCLVQTVCEAIEVWAPLLRELFAGSRDVAADMVSYLHDPLTAALLIDPSFVTIETHSLRATIVDGAFRLQEENGAPHIDVATSVDAQRFVEFLMERLLALR